MLRMPPRGEVHVDGSIYFHGKLLPGLIDEYKLRADRLLQFMSTIAISYYYSAQKLSFYRPMKGGQLSTVDSSHRINVQTLIDLLWIFLPPKLVRFELHAPYKHPPKITQYFCMFGD